MDVLSKQQCYRVQYFLQAFLFFLLRSRVQL